MSYWSVVIPEAATNVCPDPSFENATLADFWTNSGASVAERSTVRAFRGYNSLHVVTDASGDYVYGSSMPDVASAETWTGSAWLYVVTGKARLGLEVSSATGAWAAHASYAESQSTGAWERLVVTHTLSACTTAVRIKLGVGAAAVNEWYADAVQFE